MNSDLWNKYIFGIVAKEMDINIEDEDDFYSYKNAKQREIREFRQRNNLNVGTG